jgi:hypothetical protein
LPSLVTGWKRRLPLLAIEFGRDRSQSGSCQNTGGTFAGDGGATASLFFRFHVWPGISAAARAWIAARRIFCTSYLIPSSTENLGTRVPILWLFDEGVQK